MVLPPFTGYGSGMRPIALALAAALTACAPVALKSDDTRRAVTLAPFQRAAGLGTITVREGEVLYPSLVSGRPAWCTPNAVFFAWAEARAGCFFEPSDGRAAEGWLKTAYLGGGTLLSSIHYDVDVPFRVTQAPALPPRP